MNHIDFVCFLILVLNFIVVYSFVPNTSSILEDDINLEILEEIETVSRKLETAGSCQQRCQDKKFEDILKISDDYNYHLPPQSELPIRVNFSINLRNVLEVNEVAETVSLETTLRMFWKDERLSLKLESLPRSFDLLNKSFITLHPSVTNLIWIPDIFIDQAVSLRRPRFHTPPASLRVYRDGMIRYSSRVNYDVACSMDFHFYPHDVQTCLVKFESFGYTSDELQFEWVEGGSQTNKNISLAQFDVTTSLETYDTAYYDLNYPGLILKVELRRKLRYHLIQTYMVSTVFLTISWLALFLPPASIAERLAIAMTILLTLTSMFSSERRSVPRVSYVTCLDMWMVSCIVFVFIELVEFASIFLCNKHTQSKLIFVIDKSALILLPVAFIAFNVCYWPYLLNPH